MAYNRCVGTRYCANNCPYKVRRFNWFLYSQNDEFDYFMNDDLGRMVINPDVTVRSRGVMEKCSFCIQKTQKTILDAKREGREIKDGEFQTACSAVWKWFDQNGWQIRYQLTSSQLLDFLLSHGVQHIIALQYAHKPGIAHELNQVKSRPGRPTGHLPLQP